METGSIADILEYTSACSRTCRVQKNHNIFRKNTIFNEHPVGPYPHVKEKKSINRILRLYKGWDNSARPTTAKMMVGIENLE